MGADMSQFEMTDEQKALFDALTPLQQKVSTHSLSGKSNIDSYKLGGGKAKRQETAESCASEILSNPKVKAFLVVMLFSLEPFFVANSRVLHLDVLLTLLLLNGLLLAYMNLKKFSWKKV